MRRFPFDAYHRFIARIYDLAMRRVERLCLGAWRHELLSTVGGDVLEIGAGTGVNLPYYPRLNRLCVSEPDPAMRKCLRKRIDLYPSLDPVLIGDPAEALTLADQSVDFVVSTLVFCSVNDPRQAMAEVYRILKPGGQLVLMEHVAAEGEGSLLFWQRLCQPLWKRCACNCHLTRPTAKLLRDVGFQLSLRTDKMLGAPAIASPMIIGTARRP